MKRLMTAAALALLATTAHAAQHKPVILKDKGNWVAYYTISNKGNPLCGMYTFWSRSRKLTATVHLKYQHDRPLTILMAKAGWNVPEGTTVNVNLYFDDSQPFPGEATAERAADGDTVLTVGIREGTEADFMGLVADARQFKISFPDGDEPTWVAAMNGCSARAAHDNAGACRTAQQALYVLQRRVLGDVRHVAQQ